MEMKMETEKKNQNINKTTILNLNVIKNLNGPRTGQNEDKVTLVFSSDF